MWTAPEAVPIARLQLVTLAPSPDKEAVSPKTLYLVGGGQTFEITLPEDADTSKIRASLDKGVLTVDVPKTEPKKLPKPRRITVNASSASSGH